MSPVSDKLVLTEYRLSELFSDLDKRVIERTKNGDHINIYI